MRRTGRTPFTRLRDDDAATARMVQAPAGRYRKDIPDPGEYMLERRTHR